MSRYSAKGARCEVVGVRGGVPRWRPDGPGDHAVGVDPGCAGGLPGGAAVNTYAMDLTPADQLAVQKLYEHRQRQRLAVLDDKRRRLAELDKTKAAHGAALAGATGLRRAILELHSPTQDDLDDWLTCSACPPDTVYGAAEWPCETYVLARDWRP